MEGSAEGDRSVEIVSGDSSGGIYVIFDLDPSTSYFIQVAASNNALIGPYNSGVIQLTAGSYAN